MLLILKKTYLSNIYQQTPMLDNYIGILEQAIKENEQELKNPTRKYTMSETKWMQGYTQCLKDVLSDLNDTIHEEASKYSVLYKFNLN